MFWKQPFNLTIPTGKPESFLLCSPMKNLFSVLKEKKKKHTTVLNPLDLWVTAVQEL